MFQHALLYKLHLVIMYGDTYINLQYRMILTAPSRVTKLAQSLRSKGQKLRPKWFNKNDSKGYVKCIITGNSNKDPKNFQLHIRSKDKRKDLAKRFKNPNDEFKIAIVCDIWLTGQNFPVLDTMYLDKPLRDHTLLQAIARVNRVYPEKYN